VRWREQAKNLVVEVHNRGEPIPQDLLPRIFDPFRRATDRRGKEGLGLGLYIVGQIVAAHGGEVSVRSTAGEGTTVTVTMPRRRMERPAETT
jgi:signal transduction histidine kinase